MGSLRCDCPAFSTIHLDPRSFSMLYLASANASLEELSSFFILFCNHARSPMQSNITGERPVNTLPPGRSGFKIPCASWGRSLELALFLILTFAALLPRVLLARQLDVVTDETIYILAGKTYFHLTTHLTFFSNAWDYNYEHPPLVKIWIGLAIFLNEKILHLSSELFAARIPSILSGTLLALAVYILGKRPFGQAVAFAAALCLAFSPWLVYFSALAYLDMSMTMFVTLAFLLIWYAPRHPWLFPVVTSCIALAAASKYTAALALPGLLIYTIAFYLVERRSLPPERRTPLPWLWWLIACVLLPLIFFLVDPAIWRNPPHLLLRSLDFELLHATGGHAFFLNGRVYLHTPFWSILLITLTKMSLFVTVPAAAFLLLVLFRILIVYKKRDRKYLDAQTLLLFCWLLGILIPFSQLTIVVGTHYELPVAAPTALAAAYTLSTLFAFLQRKWRSARNTAPSQESQAAPMLPPQPTRRPARALLPLFLLSLVLAGPHIWGLLNSAEAEGYTSELFRGENGILQVAYPGYREGALWLAQHTQGPENVGLIALLETLQHGPGVSWSDYNTFLPARLHFSEVLPTTTSYGSYDYLIWPMHLVQRGYVLPPPRSMYIIHVITGGQTIYCDILARSTVSISR
jgi:hypothetical protein